MTRKRKPSKPIGGGGAHNPASMRNLKRGGPPVPRANLRAVTHGAGSEVILRPLCEAYLAELAEEFPEASERVLKLQARRLAKLDRLGTYLEKHGEIRHQRRGEVFPASSLEETITAAFLATQAKLEAQVRSTSGEQLADALADGAQAWRARMERDRLAAESTATEEAHHDDAA
jgi:hypothetical protein